jgi:polysaccharide biosynthesis protein PslH
MSRMKVLHLTPSLPWPPDTGGKICIWNHLRADARFAEVGLLSFAEEEPGAEALAAVRSACREVVTVRRPRTRDGVAGALRSLASDTAMNLAKYRWPVYSRALWQTVSSFFPDVVVAHNFHLAAYLLELAGPARILREQNIDSDLMERYAATCGNPALAVFARLQARRILADEARIAPRVDRCLMITSRDEARLHEIAPTARTAVVPGVIATEEYHPARPPGPGDDLLVVATGTFSFLPTGRGLLHFVEQVWPRVLAAAPRARFRVIGHCPESLRDRLAGRSGVEVLGRVESIRGHLDGAHALAVPLLAGSGMRMKIIEAMAWQVPVVTTSIGCEGIGVENGRHVLVADEPEAMASALLKIAGDAALADTLRREGRAFVEAGYSLTAGAVTETIYRECIAGRAGTRAPAPARRAP